MSENAEAVTQRLREQISQPHLNLTQLAEKIKVSYSKLRRFGRGKGKLSLTELEKIAVFFEGTTFIKP